MTKRTSDPDVGIDLNKAIEEVDFNTLEPNLRALLRLLLNKIEDLEKTVKDLRVKNQNLQDANNRLKGVSKENRTFGLRHLPGTFPQKQSGRT